MAEDDIVIGARTGLRSVFERVAMVAPSDLPVLLLGETGTGKEVVSRIVHDGSPRCDGPFWRVNCGALAPELVDSELFGHERGSFTGAIAQRKGWFEQAHGGTLFLDEIAELPLAAQVRLLRVLQEGELVRVGGAQTIAVDVRIVAATHRDLAAMVETGEFRDDLFYRISAFPIVIPPLRERSTDIAELAHHFAARAAARFALPALDLERYDLELLADHAWPGNVRELATVIDRAVLLGEGRRIDIARALNLSPRAGVRLTPPDRPPFVDRAPVALPATPPATFRPARPTPSSPPPLAVSGAPPRTSAPGHATAASSHAATGHTTNASSHAVNATGHTANATTPHGEHVDLLARSGPIDRHAMPPGPEAGADAIEPLDDVIRRHIERALAACQGRIDGPFGAARKLVINPHTLRARMRKLGVNWRGYRPDRPAP